MNHLIRFALNHRLIIVALSIVLLVGGGYVCTILPIDIFPSLTRPRVTVMTEAVGLSPEEVESLVTFPLETSLNGATGVETVRSSSGIGLSVIYVEFGWSMDVYRARQIVNERLAITQSQLPPGVQPQLTPISSIMGQIVMGGMWSNTGKTSPIEIRTIADWVVRQRLLTIPGVAQVIVMGGGRKQYQVQVNPELLISFGVTLEEVEAALKESNQNATGGYLERGSMEYLVRGLGRASTSAQIESTVVKSGKRPVLVRDIAHVVEGAQIKRGDSSVNGFPAVVLVIAKQPDADTRLVTDLVHEAIDELRQSFSRTNPDLVLDAGLYQQKTFIDLGIHNVIEALRDGAILVVIILFLFLMNLRTTFITLTAIPLSIVLTGLFFYLTGMSVNVMTLGGLAVAMGELVDDAIVDIENVFRRLTENARLPEPRNPLEVVYDASLEIRGSIVFSTMLVILVFIPLFALHGIEGRLFVPLGVAYIVSILASLIVSLTVTPVLGSLLLGNSRAAEREHDGWLLRMLKGIATPIIRLSCHPFVNTVALLLVVGAVGGSAILLMQLGSNFLPPFDEGVAQVNVVLPPGSSLEQSNRVSEMVDTAFRRHFQDKEHPQELIQSFVRRSGRAEMDEHAEGVNVTEYVVTLNPQSGISRADALATLRKELEEIPGIVYQAEQPLAHLISHMLSGVTAQIAIKVYGDDLDVLRQKAQEIKSAIQNVPGIAPPFVEAQQLIPQLRIELDRERLAQYGVTPGFVNEFIQTAMHGTEVSSILDGQRKFDLVVRLDDRYRTDFANLHRLSLDLPSGERIPLEAVAKIYEAGGPNTISRENARRRIAIGITPTDRDMGSVVADLKRIVEKEVELPEGYFVQYGGQFEAQQEATRMILLLSIVSLVGVFLVLYTLYPSTRIVLQIMLALPIAFVGGVMSLWVTGQSLNVAGMVGFISLGGISARNGILLVSHYLHLMQEEGEEFSLHLIVRGSLERLAPVLMTALTTGIGLIPLVWGGQQPGKEILYPVATVILGGLVTSTLCEYLIHPAIFYRFSGADASKL
ncbi:MAG: efflux RND transporter permease subunit, partial [Planctomycetaceae bacterium]|nr:efflux RND transporter permease subunit [Planctomycetaceae bacterium]